MKRRALIIYCDDTISGPLDGPSADNQNFKTYLKSNLGGNWKSEEIESLENPSIEDVKETIKTFLFGADYTFIVFTGHGFLNTDENNRQYIELDDGDISLLNLRTKAKRQTIIIDACRGYFSPIQELMKSLDSVNESLRYFSGNISTRELFEQAVKEAEEGLTILYAASENETALDTDKGAAYLLSLINAAKEWKKLNKKDNVLRLDLAHKLAKIYISENFETIQKPTKNKEKRLVYFPFAVKFKQINS